MVRKRNKRFSNDDQDNGDEPNFDDPEGFVDDVSDEELLGDFLLNKPCEIGGVENVVVVDNIPKVGQARQEKLRLVIQNLFSAFGTINKEFYPVDEEGNTKGYAFLEYKNSENALEAVKSLNNHRLDKSHTFAVNSFTDFQKYEHIPEKWEPPTPQPYEGPADLYNFLIETDGYDQFCVAAETEPNAIQVQFWQNTLPEPMELETRDRFTETAVKWSPQGTYIVTIHKQGVVLWGGTTFARVNRFQQAAARFVDFSPCENYLVTYGSTADGQKIIIWDIRTGLEKRTFVAISNMSRFQWSHDDRYVAYMGESALFIHETPTFFLLEMKSIKIPGIRNFSWSPTDNIIAYWVAEVADMPAKVTLMEIPRRTEIRNNTLFNVAECKMHWQQSGDYLCVKLDRFSKSRRDKKDSDVKFLGMYYNLEIFHMREKDIPVDSVEIKELILNFAWEPFGTKFAIIHGESHIANVSFYEVKKGQQPNLVKKLEKKACGYLFWSPRGQFIVLANFAGGTFEFVDSENNFVVMNCADHFRASEGEWDPTGRYFVTVVSVWKTKEDNGYNMWTFQGKVMKRVMLKNFQQFLWRPRPKTLLSEQQQKKIKKNLKKYYAQFESKDRLRTTRASKELLEKRAHLRGLFMEYRVKKIEDYNNQKTRRLELRKHVDTDNLNTEDVVEEIVEFLIKEETTIIEELSSD